MLETMKAFLIIDGAEKGLFALAHIFNLMVPRLKLLSAKSVAKIFTSLSSISFYFLTRRLEDIPLVGARPPNLLI